MGIPVTCHPLEGQHVSFTGGGQGGSSRVFRIVGVQTSEGRDHVMLRDYSKPAFTTGWLRADLPRLTMMTTCACGDVVPYREGGQCDTCDAIDEM